MRGVAVDLAALLPSRELHLRAERKSPETVKSYGDGVRRFLAWADAAGLAAASASDDLQNRRAARVVAGRSTDASDCAEMLAMLGLDARDDRMVTD